MRETMTRVVHVVGPVEKERKGPVQRCLRCDQILVRVDPDYPPVRVGAIVCLGDHATRPRIYSPSHKLASSEVTCQ